MPTSTIEADLDNVNIAWLNLHSNLEPDAGGQLRDMYGEVFDVEEYSRFKYGKKSTGRLYGQALAHSYIKMHSGVFNSDKTVVSGPSYKFLSTASHGVVDSFCRTLNFQRVIRGLEPVLQLHQIRSTVGSDAYAMGDAALRATHLDKSEYHVDTELVRDSHFIFIDDVSVTEATEKRTLSRVIPCGPKSIRCLHVASITPGYAKGNASIENTMNKAVPLDPVQILYLIQSNDFRLNTRVFRSILEWDSYTLRAFLIAINDDLLIEMFTALVSGTVEMFRRFEESTNLLLDVVSDRGFGNVVGAR